MFYKHLLLRLIDVIKMDLKNNLDCMHNLAVKNGKDNFVAQIRKFAKKFLKHKPSQNLEKELESKDRDVEHYDRLVKIMFSDLKSDYVWDAPFYNSPDGHRYRKEDELSKRDKEYIMSKIQKNVS